MAWLDPKAMQQGAGTPFAIIMILTAPLGAVCGAFWGYRRVNPASEITSKGPRYLFAKFEQEYFDRPKEIQAAELTRRLKSWIADYRMLMYLRIAISAVTLFIIYPPPGLLVSAAICWRLIAVNLEMRSVLSEVRTMWGDDVLAAVAPLPYSLR
jgi:hypothetical protein